MELKPGKKPVPCKVLRRKDVGNVAYFDFPASAFRIEVVALKTPAFSCSPAYCAVVVFSSTSLSVIRSDLILTPSP